MSNDNIEYLKSVDSLTPKFYRKYYTTLMPVFKQWYHQPEGYRPVVMGRNIPWWIDRNEVRRKCRCRVCSNEQNKFLDDCNDGKHLVLGQNGQNKMSMWKCELEENDRKSARSSPWMRYMNPASKILYDIDMIEARPKILSTVRSMYWQPAIRNYDLLNDPTSKSWNEITALNIVIDIDIKNKHYDNIFDNKIWNSSYDMLSYTADILEKEDIEYKIQSSGNGFYFIMKKIIEEEERHEDETIESFWNVIVAGWKEFVDSELKKVEEKFGQFTIDGREIYTMQFLKTPFSLHQRLDSIAVPISLDLISSIDSREFALISSPEYVLDNWNELVNVWK